MFIEVPANKLSRAKRGLIYGIAVNDADYVTQARVNGKRTICPFYSRWKNMLDRCYSANYHERLPTYIGCTVCSEWLSFSNFKLWMQTKDWQDKHLDKDLLIQGNKIYSPETCLFVSGDINSLLLDNGRVRGDYPLGVCKYKKDGTFQSDIKINGKRVYLGRYTTPEKAYSVYRSAKYKHIKNIALSQSEPLRTALLNYIIR